MLDHGKTNDPNCKNVLYCCREVAVLQSDTYLILTLKLRLAILSGASCATGEQENLKRELEGLVQLKPGYVCSITGCGFKSRNCKLLLIHLRSLHQNSNQPIKCPFNDCDRVMSSVKMLMIHIKTYHTRGKKENLNHVKIIEKLSVVKCLSVSCQYQKFKTVKELKVHLTSFHTRCNETVQCIFRGCTFATTVTGTLRSHFSKKHRDDQLINLKSEICGTEYEGEEYQTNDVDGSDAIEFEVERSGDEVEITDEDNDCSEDESEDDLNLFTRALAITINTWMCVKHIPFTTVNVIVAEVFNSYQKGVDTTKKNMEKALTEIGLPLTNIEDILKDIEKEDPFIQAQKELEEEKNRKNFIYSNFKNVKPVSVKLSREKLTGKQDSMQHVPLKESLRILLEDPTYIMQRKSDPYFHDADLVKDVRDSKSFRENKFFQQNPTAVPLLIFQDELEIVNPLGAGKSRHKILCTYYTTLEIIPPLRSKVQSIQLISLVLSRNWKKYGNEACNRNLIEDLKQLETEGIEIHNPDKKVVRAGLAYIVGDNLGQHQVAEMNSVFSSGYICRICNATYKDVCKNHLLYSGCKDEYKTEYLSEAQYDAFADKAVEGEASTATQGIKNHCVFNALRSFHCVSQLPPCLGHDFYEGVFSYDVQHYLDYLINKEKLISAEEFNGKIANCKLSGRDGKNRPKNFKVRAKNTKYEGNAGSLRVLSRILTSILADVLEESITEKYIVKLHEVSEIITAPKLDGYEIEFVMTRIILEYLDLRVEAIEELNMANARPKHHFLSHYSRSYTFHGPLIHLWAMRMEGKHCYFKNVIRASKNFINAPLTCASRHQMAQISYSFYGLFPSRRLEVPDNAPEVKEVLEVSNDAEMRHYYTRLHGQALVPNHLQIYGTKFEVGHLVVMEKMSFGTLKVGLIMGMSCYKNEVNFLVSTFVALQSKYGYYVTSESLNKETVDFDNLADHYPLLMIGTPTAFMFRLHHFISRRR